MAYFRRFCFVFCFVLFFTHIYFPASGQAVVTGVVPSPPPGFLPSMFIAHRVPQSHCSSIFHRVLLTHALARFLRVNLCTRKSPHEFIYEYMHSGGFELTKLTYTRLEDNLIRHRGDRLRVWSPDVQRPFQTKSATSIVTRVCMMLQLLGRDVWPLLLSLAQSVSELFHPLSDLLVNKPWSQVRRVFSLLPSPPPVPHAFTFILHVYCSRVRRSRCSALF